MKSSLLQLITSSRFEFIEDEEEVSSRNGSYRGIRPEALYNSVEDFKRIFSSSRVKGKFIDLGCGTGLSCLLYGALFPEREAVGIEFETSRLAHGKKFILQENLTNVHLLQEDLMTSDLPVGDTYFLYFPTGPVLDRVLSGLYSLKHHFHLVVVESHGDLIPRIKKENWLEEVERIPLHSPRHHSEALVFRMLNKERSQELLPHKLSYEDKYLLLQDNYGEWLGNTLGLEWVVEDEYDLLYPPRRIRWSEVRSVLDFYELPERIQHLLVLRKQEGFIKGEKIRKIYMKPEAIELSSGEIMKSLSEGY